MKQKTSDVIAEQIKARALKVTAMQELFESTNGAPFNADQSRTYDELDSTVKEIDAYLERLAGLEAVIARSAQPIGSKPQIQQNGRNRPMEKGCGYARLVQLMVRAKGNDMLAQQMAQSHFPEQPDMARYFEGRSLGIIPRAATTPGTTLDPAWAGSLVYANQLSSELIELVRAESILGQLNLRMVPFNVRIPRETAFVGVAQWVGEGLPKPVGKGGYDFVTIPWAKAALILAITEELARFSDPSAETLMRDGLVRAISQFLDTQFISTTAAIANLSPGGILQLMNVAYTFASSGSALENIQYDLSHAVRLLHQTNAPIRPVWIMSPGNRVAIASIINAFGASAFPTLTANGTLFGYPVVTSAYVPDTEIVLMDQDKILHASDPNVTIDVSSEASVQMDSVPANPPTPLVSFWQQNMIGLRAEKFEYWKRANDTCIVLISAVAYGTVAPPPGLLAANGGQVRRMPDSPFHPSDRPREEPKCRR